MTAKEIAVWDAALHWWRSRRPTGWSQHQHMMNAVVNCRNDAEQALARAIVAALTPGKGKTK